MPHTSASHPSKTSSFNAPSPTKKRFKKLISLSTALAALAWSEAEAQLSESILNGYRQARTSVDLQTWYSDTREALLTAHATSANQEESKTDLMRAFTLAFQGAATHAGLTAYDETGVTPDDINAKSTTDLEALRLYLRIKKKSLKEKEATYALRQTELEAEIAQLEEDIARKQGQNNPVVEDQKTAALRKVELNEIIRQRTFFTNRLTPELEGETAEFRSGGYTERGLDLQPYLMLTKGGDSTVEAESRTSSILFPYAAYKWKLDFYGATTGKTTKPQDMFLRDQDASFRFDTVNTQYDAVAKLMGDLNSHNPFLETTKGELLKKKLVNAPSAGISSIEDIQAQQQQERKGQEEWVDQAAPMTGVADPSVFGPQVGRPVSEFEDQTGDLEPDRREQAVYSKLKSSRYDYRDRPIHTKSLKKGHPTEEVRETETTSVLVKEAPLDSIDTNAAQTPIMKLTGPISQLSTEALKMLALQGGERGDKAISRLNKLRIALSEGVAASKKSKKVQPSNHTPSYADALMAGIEATTTPFDTSVISIDLAHAGQDVHFDDPGYGAWGEYQSAETMQGSAGEDSIANPGLEAFARLFGDDSSNERNGMVKGLRLILNNETPAGEFNPAVSEAVQREAAKGADAVIVKSHYTFHNEWPLASSWDRTNPNPGLSPEEIAADSADVPKLSVGRYPVEIANPLDLVYPEKKKRRKNKTAVEFASPITTDTRRVSFSDNDEADRNRPGFEGITGGKFLNPLTNESAVSPTNSDATSAKPRRGRTKDVQAAKKKARKAAKLGRKNS